MSDLCVREHIHTYTRVPWYFDDFTRRLIVQKPTPNTKKQQLFLHELQLPLKIISNKK